MAHKLPHCWGEPAVSHWHRPSPGFTWHQSGSNCPQIWSLYLHQHHQQWALCGCGVWWFWWPFRWEGCGLCSAVVVKFQLPTIPANWFRTYRGQTFRCEEKKQGIVMSWQGLYAVIWPIPVLVVMITYLAVNNRGNSPGIILSVMSIYQQRTVEICA